MCYVSQSTDMVILKPEARAFNDIFIVLDCWLNVSWLEEVLGYLSLPGISLIVWADFLFIGEPCYVDLEDFHKFIFTTCNFYLAGTSCLLTWYLPGSYQRLGVQLTRKGIRDW